MQIYRDRIVDQHANVLSYRKIGNSRLLKLAAFLRLLPPEKFDLEYWVSNSKGALRGNEEADPRSCGTKACAMGWATTMPLFRRLGLVFNHGTALAQVVVAIEREDLGYSCHDSLYVACHMFAISYQESELLFTPTVQGHRSSPSEVADLIERLVQFRGKDLGKYGNFPERLTEQQLHALLS